MNDGSLISTKFIAGVLLFFAVTTSAVAQIDTTRINPFKPQYLQIEFDEIKEQYLAQPNFGMHKDNYFITGIPTNKAIDSQTADAKFQISIRQRLFNTIMPFNTQLMLIYTQKSFWDIYEESFPFADNNYNPGLLLTKPIISKNSYKGVMLFSIEHESNGKGGLENRSWNYITLSGIYFFNIYFHAQTKVWYGWAGKDNADLLDYRGYGLFALNFRSQNERIATSLILNPIKNFSINTQLEISYKIDKRANQYLFLQWYNGYGEGLLDYNKYVSMVRAGICIKSSFRSLH